ncbi:MAG: DUF2339 domain-containing protein [Sphingobacteriales bacterium]|nr:DUF2339 domain-containing protein [Sphingobacteriales bacterium]OJW04692.1 MAG: hypothetical protein BGO52_19480 [Sphingobacteriales bacterium 44-61]
MNAEDKIRQLEEQINRLSADLHTSHQRLLQLQEELRMLKQGMGLPMAKRALSTPIEERQKLGLEHFIGLKLIHLVGIIVLVIGISIGVKYAIDGQLISEAMRIVLAYAAGILLLILSVRLKKNYQLFSAILFSGSMASVYFTTYAAFAYYHFIPGTVAFLVMVALTVYTIFMAIRYDRKEIAIVGMVGAYGIPFLVSANSERVDLFLSYILLINLGIVFLSFRKSWKLVGQLAMLITWVLFIGWAMLRYEEPQQLLALAFMIAYYLLFCLDALAFLFRQKKALSFVEIQQLIINNTALYLAALCICNHITASGSVFVWLAIMALGMAVLFPLENRLQQLLTIQALIVLLLFISFKWEGLTVTLLWVAVAVSLFIWGIIRKKSWVRLAAVFLVGLTLAKLLILDSQNFSAIQKITCYIAIGILLLLGSFYYQKLGLGEKKD